MERLTIIDEVLEEIYFEVPSDREGAYNILDIAKYSDEEEKKNILLNIAERLVAYENTDLTPKQIEKCFKMPVSRWSYEHYDELLQLEDEGRLIKLPCAAGDIIWLADLDRELSINAKQSVQPLKVCFFRVTDAKHVTIVCETQGESWYYVHPLKLGKTVFLTKEEAEKVLKGAENENI